MGQFGGRAGALKLRGVGGAGRDSADKLGEMNRARCASRWDRMFTFCSPLSVTNIGERSCSPAAGRGAEPSLPGTGQLLLRASLSAQLVAVQHHAVAARAAAEDLRRRQEEQERENRLGHNRDRVNYRKAR